MEAALAETLLRQGRIADAEALLSGAVSGKQAAPGWSASYLRAVLGATLAAKGSFSEAESLLSPALQEMSGLRNRTFASEWYQQDQVRQWLASAREKQGKTAIATAPAKRD